MHSIGILHKDIKACNILIKEEVVKGLERGTGRVVSDVVTCIADLGFAELYKLTDRYQKQFLCGTPGYIDPAVLKCTHNYVPQSDYFSLGALMFNLLVGGGDNTLFSGSSAR